MAKTEYTFDPSQIMKMFENFDEKTRKKVFRSTLRKAAGILVRESRKKLREKIGEAADHPNRWDGKKLLSGIKAKIAKNNRMVKVNILGDFRLKFFELGTDDRYRRRRKRRLMRRKGYSGRMTATHFFSESKRTTEAKVFSTISTNLAKTIERINKKQHG